jgi:hypothetical protein
MKTTIHINIIVNVMIKATIYKFNSTMKSPYQMCHLYDWYIYLIMYRIQEYWVVVLFIDAYH